MGQVYPLSLTWSHGDTGDRCGFALNPRGHVRFTYGVCWKQGTTLLNLYLVWYRFSNIYIRQPLSLTWSHGETVDSPCLAHAQTLCTCDVVKGWGFVLRSKTVGFILSSTPISRKHHLWPKELGRASILNSLTSLQNQSHLRTDKTDQKFGNEECKDLKIKLKAPEQKWKSLRPVIIAWDNSGQTIRAKPTGW